MAQEDKWVDWQGVDPELDWPVIKAHYKAGWFTTSSTWWTNNYNQLIADSYTAAWADWNGGDDHGAIQNLIVALGNVRNYLSTLNAACGTNNWNEETTEPMTGEDVMIAWLDAAGVLV